MSKLGKQGKDVITGFVGTITSEHHYLTGCTQYGLQPKVKNDGTLGETMFFDENRVIVSGEAIDLNMAVRGEPVIAEHKPVFERRSGCDSRERP